MKAIILLGAPGAGKGTAAEDLRKQTDFQHVSTGDMLREAVKSGSAVGERAKSYMEAGTLVPDEVIVDIVKERMDRDGPDAKYMFDGFPRTMKQAQMLDQVLDEHGADLTHVLLLEITEDVVLDRIAGRRICKSCGAVYHVSQLTPGQACDQCGGELYQRPDDNEETVRKRLQVFRDQTSSLIDYYEQKGVLHRVDANRTPEEVQADLLGLIRESTAGL